MGYLTVRDADVKDKVVLMRVDYNVPMKDGKITDDLRIRASLPTLDYLLEAGAKKIVLVSHLGRPEGKNNPELTLAPVAKELRKLLPEQKIDFCALPEKGKKIPKMKYSCFYPLYGINNALVELNISICISNIR